MNRQITKQEYKEIILPFYKSKVSIDILEILYKTEKNLELISNLIDLSTSAVLTLELRASFKTNLWQRLAEHFETKIEDMKTLFEFALTFFSFMSTDIKVTRVNKTMPPRLWSRFYGRALLDRNVLLGPMFPVDWLRRMDVFGPDSMILDLGCGFGFYSRLFRVCFEPKAIWGMDKPFMIFAAADEIQTKLLWDQSLLLRYPPVPEVWPSIIWASEFIHTLSLDKAEVFVRDCYQKITKGGFLIINEIRHTMRPYGFYLSLRLKQRGSEGSIHTQEQIQKICIDAKWTPIGLMDWGPYHTINIFRK